MVWARYTKPTKQISESPAPPRHPAASRVVWSTSDNVWHYVHTKSEKCPTTLTKLISSFGETTTEEVGCNLGCPWRRFLKTELNQSTASTGCSLIDEMLISSKRLSIWMRIAPPTSNNGNWRLVLCGVLLQFKRLFGSTVSGWEGGCSP